MCENCLIEAPNRNKYCFICFTTKPELKSTLMAINEDEDDSDDAEMFSFDGDMRKEQADFGGGSFVKSGVTLDKETGQFVGVD